MEIATKGQLRWAFARWALVTVPLILLLGFASSQIAPGGADNRWYAALVKPAGTPPDWVFGVVWTTLYVMLGLAVAMILHARGSRLRGLAILLFVAQLALNLIWSPMFFGAHQVEPALITIIAILIVAAVTAWLFGRIRPVAGLLLVPYLLWLSYATYLNWGIDHLNPNAATLVPGAPSAQMDI
jgi:tryptophan-rich sensory protein